MATLTQVYKPWLTHLTIATKIDESIEKLIPRRCMVVSTAVLLGGLVAPALMAAELLPVTLLSCFVSFVLTATGITLHLIFCGEI
jgi:hypothetical protein